MNFDTSKILGGVGALLMFIGTIPFVGGYTIGGLGFIGFVLLLIGMWGLSDYYKESGIFSNALYGTIAGFVGSITAVVVFIGFALTNLQPMLFEIFPNWDGNWATLGQQIPKDPSTINFANVAPFIAGILGVLLIIFIAVLVVAIFYRRSLSLLKERSGVGLFGTVGTLLLVGAILTIVLAGVILVWIATLILAIAFFQMKLQQPTSAAAPT